MALALGTNSGFVTVAPVDDPVETNGTMDYVARVTGDTSPHTAGKITEIGWWCDNDTGHANFEVGLYAADGATVPGEAGTRLYVDDTNAKGMTAGWKRVTVDWDIDPDTVYWLGLQLDNTTTTTNINIAASGGSGIDDRSTSTSLPDPFGGGVLADNDGMLAIYAVWTAAGTNCQLNIGDAWKPITAMQINIGDAWKPVVGAQINIGDVWKAVF